MQIDELIPENISTVSESSMAEEITDIDKEPEDESKETQNFGIFPIFGDFYGKFSPDDKKSLWKTTAYTLQTTEALIRLENKPLLGMKTLSDKKSKMI
jgi:hypothetical protein